MEPDLAPDPTRVEQVLAERARALARPIAPPPAGDVLDLVVVALGPERYGLDIQCVQEIQPLAALTLVPGLPAHWAGLINLRGRLLPVLDLRPYLSLPASGAPVPERKVVIASSAAALEGQGLTVAVLADDVLDLRRLPLAELGPPLAGAPLAARRGHVVRGVTADLLTVLDLPALLADPALIVEEKPA